MGTWTSDTINGGGGDDQLHGNTGHDTLSGGGGDDRLYGGEGDDVLIGGGGNDQIDGGAGFDYAEIDRRHATVSQHLNLGNPAVKQTIDGSASVVNVEQIAFYSGSGDDHLIADHLDLMVDGGADFDTGVFNFSALATQIVFDVAANLAGTVKVGTTSIRNIERIEFVAGAGHDRITGGAFADYIEGRTGDDVLAGMGGDDRLYGGEGYDDLGGGEGNDTIDGGGHEDDIWGEDGDDTLNGGVGANELDGGAGIDHAIIDLGQVTSAIVFDAARNGSFTFADGTTVTGIERYTITGGSQNDQMTGGAYDDRFLGGLGNDTLRGGGGRNHLDGGAGADMLYGGSGEDVLLGGSEDDTIHGGQGRDTIDGGAGIDLAVIDRRDATTGNRFYLNQPNEVQTLDNGTTVANVERVRFMSGSGDDDLTGSYLDDDFYGGGGNDHIFGAGGQDRLFGEAGNDFLMSGAGSFLDGGIGIDQAGINLTEQTIAIEFDATKIGSHYTFVDGTTVTNIESFFIWAGKGDDQLTGGAYYDWLKGDEGADILRGGGGNDALEGGNGDDRLYGEDGDDLLADGGGVDYLDGGAGIDAISVNSSQMKAGLTLDFGRDGVSKLLNGTTIANIEAIRFYSGSGDDHLTGGDFADEIYGGKGRDVIYGKGNDFLAGEEGDDEFHLLHGGDRGRVDGGAGTDFLKLDLSAATANLEFSIYDSQRNGAVINGIEVVGIERVHITGGSGRDRLAGGQLADELYGGGGQDELQGMGGNDRLFGGAGDDYLFAGIGESFLDGGRRQRPSERRRRRRSANPVRPGLGARRGRRGHIRDRRR